MKFSLYLSVLTNILFFNMCLTLPDILIKSVTNKTDHYLTVFLRNPKRANQNTGVTILPNQKVDVNLTPEAKLMYYHKDYMDTYLALRADFILQHQSNIYFLHICPFDLDTLKTLSDKMSDKINNLNNKRNLTGFSFYHGLQKNWHVMGMKQCLEENIESLKFDLTVTIAQDPIIKDKLDISYKVTEQINELVKMAKTCLIGSDPVQEGAQERAQKELEALGVLPIKIEQPTYKEYNESIMFARIIESKVIQSKK